MKTGQPLSDIAYACGFRDYTYFARGFRQRFGTTPGAVGAGVTGNDNARVRADNRAKSKGPTKRRDQQGTVAAISSLKVAPTLRYMPTGGPL